MSDENGKIQVDFGELTLGELDELSHEFGAPLAPMMQGVDQFKAMAGAVCKLRQRNDPTYTLADALQIPMNQLELTSGEVPAADPGGVPQPSPEFGDSTLPTS